MTARGREDVGASSRITVSTGHTRRDAYQYLLAMNAALELVAS
jgi:hypothetical protein